MGEVVRLSQQLNASTGKNHERPSPDMDRINTVGPVEVQSAGHLIKGTYNGNGVVKILSRA